MANPVGFLNIARKDNPYRKPEERLKDWQELQVPLPAQERQAQASRCMSCGVPFCHSGSFYGESRLVSGCPNDNLIPEWQDYLSQGKLKQAFERLSRTNPLPEMTGRVCPAPCEKGCVEGLNGSGVTIHDNERFIIDTAFEKGWVAETGRPNTYHGKTVAVIGSGPAGLSAAWRANQLGYKVTVFEKSDRFGGLLMYGIPNMKLDKSIVERRIALMKAVGIEFVANCEVGIDRSVAQLKATYDHIILAAGAGEPRDLNVPGREARGVEFAVDFLTQATKTLLDTGHVPKTLKGKHVVVIGGGDTGNDCLATALRMGAASVKQLEITPALPNERAIGNPWPEYPVVARTGYGQEEAALNQGQVTYYQRATTAFEQDGTATVVGVQTQEVDDKFQPVAGSQQRFEADLVLLAMGFTGPSQGLFDRFGVTRVLDDYSTNQDQIFVAGDAKRGPSLVIWAIREGRMAAERLFELDCPKDKNS